MHLKQVRKWVVDSHYFGSSSILFDKEAYKIKQCDCCKYKFNAESACQLYGS